MKKHRRRRKPPKKDGWYIRKGFGHFDRPLDFASAEKLVTDPTKVVGHAFLPFLGYTKKERRFAKKKDGTKKVWYKEREIKYCAHRDGYVHSYYAKIATEKYDQIAQKMGIDHVSIGYRSGKGSNIELASDAFDEIESRAPCTVICIDLSKFFDRIDHQKLFDSLKSVLGKTRLPDDWMKIYRSMTKYSWVSEDAAFARLGVKKGDEPRPLCSIGEYREKIRGDSGSHARLIQTNKHDYGIPQGSPISAVFSNISMIEFDISVSEFCQKFGIFYRRYSDDILLICPNHHASRAIDELKKLISKAGPMHEINEEKTEISKFQVEKSGALS